MNFARILSTTVMTFFLSATALAGKKEVPHSVEGTVKVSAEEVIELAESKPDLVIVDARKPSDYQKGHLEGAVNLPNTETTPESLAKVVGGKATPVLFYCNGIKCGRSVDASKKALAAGYTNIYWFRGGVEEWQAKGYPLAKD